MSNNEENDVVRQEEEPVLQDGTAAVETFPFSTSISFGAKRPSLVIQEQPQEVAEEGFDWKLELGDSDENDDEEYAKMIQEMPEACQQAVKVAACLGSLDVNLLNICTCVDVQDLKTAADKGIIVMNEDGHAFSNPKVQGALYRLLVPREERASFHATLGRKLVKGLSQDQLQEYDYIVLRQFYLGQEALRNRRERNAIASLCLSAGEVAVAKTKGFSKASKYFEFGISLLQGTWDQQEYDLSLALYNAAAEVEYCIANFDRMEMLIEEILQHARHFSDTLSARATRVYSLASRNQLTLAIQEGLHVLERLGERFPSQIKKHHVALELWKTKRLLGNKTNEMILRMPLMTDPDKIAIVQMLNLMYSSAFRMFPPTAVLVILRLVQLTVLHGLSTVSSVGFSQYSAILCTFSKDKDAGYSYGQLALALLDKFQAKEWLPRVYVGIYGTTFCNRHALNDLLEPLQHAYNIGLETGDIEFAMRAANMRCSHMVFSGEPLSRVDEEAGEYYRVALLRKQEAALLLMETGMQWAQNLMGKSPDPLVLSGDIVEQDAIFARAKQGKNEMSVNFLHYSLLVLAYIFNDYEKALKEAGHLDVFLRPPYAHPCRSCFLLFPGLAALAAYPNQRGFFQRRRLLSFAKRRLKQLEEFALSSPENSLAKALLMRAEYAAATGKGKLARCKYMEAIGTASQFKDLLTLSVACERTARFIQTRNEEASFADRYFRQAHASYEKYGAMAKVNDLEREFPNLFSDQQQ